MKIVWYDRQITNSVDADSPVLLLPGHQQQQIWPTPGSCRLCLQSFPVVDGLKPLKYRSRKYTGPVTVILAYFFISLAIKYFEFVSAQQTTLLKIAEDISWNIAAFRVLMYVQKQPQWLVVKEL